MKYEIPECCGRRMKAWMETSSFIELSCEKCGDMVYLKKSQSLKPALIDD
jgi:hypothetical protein